MFLISTRLRRLAPKLPLAISGVVCVMLAVGGPWLAGESKLGLGSRWPSIGYVGFFVYLFPPGWLLLWAAFGQVKTGLVAYAVGGTVLVLGSALAGVVMTGRPMVPEFWPWMWLLWPGYLLVFLHVLNWAPHPSY